MSISHAVFLPSEETLTRWDLEGLRIGTHEDGSHEVELGLGCAFLRYDLELQDGAPLSWNLWTAPSVVHAEYELRREGVEFSVGPVALSVRPGEAVVAFEDPGGPAVAVREVRFGARLEPFGFALELVLEGERSLTLREDLVWRLEGAPGRDVASGVRFTASFSLGDLASRQVGPERAGEGPSPPGVDAGPPPPEYRRCPKCGADTFHRIFGASGDGSGYAQDECAQCGQFLAWYEEWEIPE